MATRETATADWTLLLYTTTCGTRLRGAGNHRYTQIYIIVNCYFFREIKVKQFSVPLLKMANGKSLSNHEAVAATFVLK